ncbi:MAG: nucleotidyltransferase family protein [Methylophilaceae bacterium]
MENIWKSAVVTSTSSAEDALRTLNLTGLRIVMVVDEQYRLMGVFTDGDVRRGILNRLDFSLSVTSMMRAEPVTALVGTSRETLRKMMESRSVMHIPLLDNAGHLVGLETLQDVMSPPLRDNWVFLMAGGFGKRLGRLTDECPKPLLPVGGKPILESILESFIAAGFKKFFISVHYLADHIKAHFEDGSRWGATIKYIEEEIPLGTAGALGLLPESIDAPLIMMNGDLLTRVDFNALLEFHQEQDAKVTMCVREYDMQVPFGVVEGDESLVTSIVEKPVHRFFVNAGIYVISPEAISLTRPPHKVDMPDFVTQLINNSSRVSKFPIYEYWLDIGRPDDFERAQLGVAHL